MRKLVCLFLLMHQSAFAICEQERRRYEHYRKLCIKLTATSEITGIAGTVAGGAIAIPTLGISLIVGGLAATVPAIMAHNACNKRDEKLKLLNQCEEAVSANIKFIESVRIIADQEHQKEAERLRKEDEERQKKILKEQARINKEDQEREYRRSICKSGQREEDIRMNQFIQELVDEGYDITLPKTQALINRERKNLANIMKESLRRR